MRPPADQAVPVRANPRDNLSSSQQIRSVRSLRWKQMRILLTTTSLLIGAVAGWKAWDTIANTSSQRQRILEANIDDGSLSSSPFLAPAESDQAVPRPAIEPLLAAPDSPALPTLDLTPGDVATADGDRAIDVWLTGTIEDMEPKQNKQPAARVSGGPTDASVVR